MMAGITGNRAFGPLLALLMLAAAPLSAEPYGYPTGQNWKDWYKRYPNAKYFAPNSQRHVVVIGGYRQYRRGHHGRRHYRRQVIGGTPIVRSINKALRIVRQGGTIHVLSHVRGRPVTITPESVKIAKRVTIRGARWDVGDSTSARSGFPENLADSNSYLTPGHHPVCMTVDVVDRSKGPAVTLRHLRFRASGHSADGGTCIHIRRGGVSAKNIGIEQGSSWTGISVFGGWLSLQRSDISGGRSGIALSMTSRGYAQGPRRHRKPLLLLRETLIDGADIGIQARAGDAHNPYLKSLRRGRYRSRPSTDIVIAGSTILDGRRGVVLEGPVSAEIRSQSLIRGMSELAVHAVRASVHVTGSYIEFNQGHGIVVYRGGAVHPGRDGRGRGSSVHIVQNFVRYNGGNGIAFHSDAGARTIVNSGKPGLYPEEWGFGRRTKPVRERLSGGAGLGSCDNPQPVAGDVRVQCNDIILNRGYGLVVAERPDTGDIAVVQNEIWGNEFGCIDFGGRHHSYGVRGTLENQCFCLKRSRKQRHRGRRHGETSGRMSRYRGHYERCKPHRSRKRR